MNNKITNTKNLTLMAIISALAYISIFVFRVPISFLSYEIKDVIICIGGLYLGAIPSLIMCFVVSIIEMITVSDSGIIGFFMNFLASAFYIVPICIVYKKSKSIIKGIILGTISMAVIMFLFNIFITPLYLKVSLKETVNLLFTLITPFNLVKGALNGLLIWILYKPMLKALERSER